MHHNDRRALHHRRRIITFERAHRKVIGATAAYSNLVLMTIFQETKMKFALIGAAALVAAASATPALAQAAISDLATVRSSIRTQIARTWGWATVYRRRLLSQHLAEQPRVHGASLAPSPSDAPRIVEVGVVVARRPARAPPDNEAPPPTSLRLVARHKSIRQRLHERYKRILFCVRQAEVPDFARVHVVG
jgi:hypothetical protein